MTLHVLRLWRRGYSSAGVVASVISACAFVAWKCNADKRSDNKRLTFDVTHFTDLPFTAGFVLMKRLFEIMPSNLPHFVHVAHPGPAAGIVAL